MKVLFFMLFSLSIFCFAQDVPIAGKTFTINYSPPENSKLRNSETMSVVYVFDFWGTSYYYSHGADQLFLNVLSPDSGRAHTVKMEKEKSKWKSIVEIPEDATLLSYYFTNGEYFDYNNKKTFVSYIYNEENKPVRNARFRNVDFLVMAGESIGRQITEIENELKDYPDNYIAYVPYWRMKMGEAKSLNELDVLRKEFEEQFNKLFKEFGENHILLKTKASVYYHLPRYYFNFDKKSPEAINISNSMYGIIGKIPEKEKGPYLTAAYSCYQRGKESEIFVKEIVGKEAPKFEFIDIKGDSYNLSDFSGKYVLLDFWGIWCSPCVHEIPYIKKAYEKFKNHGFEIISISSDLVLGKKSEDEFKNFLFKNEMNWIQVLDTKNGDLMRRYKINKFPTLYLINKKGFVIAVDEGLTGIDLENTLSKYLTN